MSENRTSYYSPLPASEWASTESGASRHRVKILDSQTGNPAEALCGATLAKRAYRWEPRCLRCEKVAATDAEVSRAEAAKVATILAMVPLPDGPPKATPAWENSEAELLDLASDLKASGWLETALDLERIADAVRQLRERLDEAESGTA